MDVSTWKMRVFCVPRRTERILTVHITHFSAPAAVLADYRSTSFTDSLPLAGRGQPSAAARQDSVCRPSPLNNRDPTNENVFAAGISLCRGSSAVQSSCAELLTDELEDVSAKGSSAWTAPTTSVNTARQRLRGHLLAL